MIGEEISVSPDRVAASENQSRSPPVTYPRGWQRYNYSVSDGAGTFSRATVRGKLNSPLPRVENVNAPATGGSRGRRN